MGAKPAKPMEGRGWSVSGRKPGFAMEEYWKEQQAKLEPYVVQGKGKRLLSLREFYTMCREMRLSTVPQDFTHHDHHDHHDGHDHHYHHDDHDYHDLKTIMTIMTIMTIITIMIIMNIMNIMTIITVMTVMAIIFGSDF